jgi:hypothetical protein
MSARKTSYKGLQYVYADLYIRVADGVISLNFSLLHFSYNSAKVIFDASMSYGFSLYAAFQLTHPRGVDANVVTSYRPATEQVMHILSCLLVLVLVFPSFQRSPSTQLFDISI